MDGQRPAHLDRRRGRIDVGLRGAVDLVAYSAEAVEVAALLSVALSCAAEAASTIRLPATSRAEPTIQAFASDACAPLKALDSSGSPSKASIALNSTFCGFQPSVLKASVTPTPVSPEAEAVSTVASMVDVLAACTVRSPVVVVTSAPAIDASAEASTRLVTTWPPPAITVPLPQALPPEAVRLVSERATSVAASSAVTAMLPACTCVPVTAALTAERTSFSTTEAA
jgi:hypothetical protein